MSQRNFFTLSDIQPESIHLAHIEQKKDEKSGNEKLVDKKNGMKNQGMKNWG